MIFIWIYNYWPYNAIYLLHQYKYDKFMKPDVIFICNIALSLGELSWILSL